MKEIGISAGTPEREKLIASGFSEQAGRYVRTTAVADGQMDMHVIVSSDGTVSAEIIDRASGEEYVLHRVPGASGAFVGRVRAEYETILARLMSECFARDVFGSEQAKAVIAYARDRYGDEPEFLWQKTPDNAVLRRQDTQKWYAALLTVSRRKLGLESDEPVEIIDLRMKPEEAAATVDDRRYFPGYHMNKKHWITICLDGTVSDGEIFRRMDDSYVLASKHY